jgi:mRNA-degrading endonuclease RelE of RelBE toxin-antitoxin system
MKSFTTPSFWEEYRALPSQIRQQAREAYKLFKDNPYHPGLHFKQINAAQSIYSTRISRDYRALGIRDGDEIIWFWIGPHTTYDKLISRF